MFQSHSPEEQVKGKDKAIEGQPVLLGVVETIVGGLVTEGSLKNTFKNSNNSRGEAIQIQAQTNYVIFKIGLCGRFRSKPR